MPSPCKMRRMQARRDAGKGSFNVRQKRTRYSRWAGMSESERRIARLKGANQFLTRTVKKEV